MSEEILKKCIHDINGALAALLNFANHLEKYGEIEEPKEVAAAAKRSIQKIVVALESLRRECKSNCVNGSYI